MVRVLLLSALMFGGKAWADDAQGGGPRFTMDEAVARALATSADLRADQKDVHVARATLLRSQVLLPSNPYFSGGAQSFFERTGPSGQPAASSSNFTLGYGGSLSQELEIAGQRSRRVEVAERGVDRAVWEAKNAEKTLVASVKTYFVRALASANRVTLAQRAFDAVDELSRGLGSEVPAEDLARIRFNIVQVQLSKGRQELIEAEQANRDALAGLRYALDLPMEARFEIVGALETQVLPVPPPAELGARALRQRADLEALRARALGANREVELVRREKIPNVTVSGSVSRYSNDTFAGGDLSFYIPVFDRHDGEIAEAVADDERMTHMLRDLERAIEWQVQHAYGAYVTAGASMRRLQTDILPRSDENLAIERRLFEQGRVDAVDMLGIQIDATSARGDYLDAMLAYNEALIELERVTGGSVQNDAEPASPKP